MLTIQSQVRTFLGMVTVLVCGCSIRESKVPRTTLVKCTLEGQACLREEIVGGVKVCVAFQDGKEPLRKVMVETCFDPTKSTASAACRVECTDSGLTGCTSVPGELREMADQCSKDTLTRLDKHLVVCALKGQKCNKTSASGLSCDEYSDVTEQAASTCFDGNDETAFDVCEKVCAGTCKNCPRTGISFCKVVVKSIDGQSNACRNVQAIGTSPGFHVSPTSSFTLSSVGATASVSQTFHPRGGTIALGPQPTPFGTRRAGQASTCFDHLLDVRLPLGDVFVSGFTFRNAEITNSNVGRLQHFFGCSTGRIPPGSMTFDFSFDAMGQRVTAILVPSDELVVCTSPSGLHLTGRLPYVMDGLPPFDVAIDLTATRAPAARKTTF